MLASRRTFLALAAGCSAAASFPRSVAAGAAWAQRAGDLAQSGPGLEQRDKDPFDVSEGAGPKPDPKRVLEANQKDIKRDLMHLSEIVEHMQKRIDEQSTKDVLSLEVLRDTDEIERLARHMRSLLRG